MSSYEPSLSFHNLCGSWQVSATAGVNAIVPGSKAGFEMWICDFQCAFNDFSHCKFPDCSLLHWQVDAIIGFCNIRHFMEATEVWNSVIFLKHFSTAITETTRRRLHWWRIPACKCMTKVLKEKVMLFAKASPCRIKHVLSHLFRPIFVLILILQPIRIIRTSTSGEPSRRDCAWLPCSETNSAIARC